MIKTALYFLFFVELVTLTIYVYVGVYFWRSLRELLRLYVVKAKGSLRMIVTGWWKSHSKLYFHVLLGLKLYMKLEPQEGWIQQYNDRELVFRFCCFSNTITRWYWKLLLTWNPRAWTSLSHKGVTIALH